MLFERVKGAKLVLRGKANSKASVALGMKVNKKLLTYYKETLVSDDGYVTFILPYSCYFNNGVISTGEFYNISLTSDETGRNIAGKVSIKEVDVTSGNQVATSSIFLFRG